MGRSATCSSSSIDSSSSSTYSSTSLHNQDLSTDLRLGLSISSSQDNLSSTSREHRRDWPPIKPLLRRTLADGNQKYSNGEAALFVKVYMEGIPIGRKLDLFSHHGYSHLITTLSDMFRTPILCPDVDLVHSGQHHVLTYEDKDGDWMMVGDVPWELFLTTVKRLKITRADRC